LTAFGCTAYPGTKACDDANLNALVASGAPAITIFGKTWDLHVTEVLKTTLDENLRLIKDSCVFLKKKNRTVIFDAEHFFDGYRANAQYAMQALAAAVDGGAQVVVLCDTNGGSLPAYVYDTVRAVVARFPNVTVGIHTHNDGGLAVANTLMAVEAGASQVQGTMNGIGERCGNADLVQIIANLQLKMGMKAVPQRNIKDLFELSHYVSEISNLKHPDNHPFVGKSAFAHKAGVHINAVVKVKESYEHVAPEAVGNSRRLLVSELSGKTSIVEAAKEMGFELDKRSAKAQKLHETIFARENEGYQFEAAEASFKVIIERALNERHPFFTTVDFRSMVSRRADGTMFSEATVKLLVGKEMVHTVAEGDGPVNALDNAVRKALSEFYPVLKSMHLSDFKVRVLNEKAGTAAKVRVLIESQDASDVWTTVGVSENIIEASWLGLVDSIEYKLIKDGIKPKV
jgi:2-isopropylmalate synthase